MVNLPIWLVVAGIFGWMFGIIMGMNAQQGLLPTIEVGRRHTRGRLIPVSVLWD